MALVAVIIALSLGSRLFVPLTLGLVLAAVLYPLVGLMRRVHVPTSLGAALAVLLAIVVLVLAGSTLEPPIRSLSSQIPKTLIASRSRLQSLGIKLPGGGQSETPDSSSKQAGGGNSGNGGSGGGDSSGSGITGALTRAFGITSAALFALVEILLLAFFILAAGDAWHRKLREASPSDDHRKKTLDAVFEIRSVVLRYLLMTVIINAAQAVVVTFVVLLLGYPTPILWGILTFIAEFVPFFGGAAMVVLLLLAGLAGSHGIGHALLAPIAYLVITTLQNNLVSPAAYGKGLRLNPTAILVGVMFWGVVWGLAGVFLAVPLLAAIRIIADRTEAYRPVAVFLAD
jgi:predicted PurR-regulated permease PerM